MRSNNRWWSWLTSLPRALMLLLLLLLASAALSQQQQQQPPPRRALYSVSEGEVNCGVGSAKPHCTDRDCFVVEKLPEGPADAAALMESEWSEMSQQLQELATQERLDDTYPSAMQIMLPRSGRRQRTCPVAYELDVNRDRVPMLLVQARCIHQRCSHMDSCRCLEAQQYRQVYARLPGCTGPAGTEAAPTAPAGTVVFVKTFINVTVNCVAQHSI